MVFILQDTDMFGREGLWHVMKRKDLVECHSIVKKGQLKNDNCSRFLQSQYKPAS